MYTFTFRVGLDKKTFDETYSEITVQAPGYYDEATITKKDENFLWIKRMSGFWSAPTLPPCGARFNFDEPFSPFSLFFALNNDEQLYFEVETDYSGDLSKWPPKKNDKKPIERILFIDKNGDMLVEEVWPEGAPEEPEILY